MDTLKKKKIPLLKIISAGLLIIITPLLILAFALKPKFLIDTYTTPDGGEYSFSISLRGPGTVAREISTDKTDYKYLSVTTRTFSINSLLGYCGEITLSTHECKDGIYCYLDSDSREDLFFTIHTKNKNATKLSYVKDNTIHTSPLSEKTLFNSDNQIYLEGGVYLKLGQISQLRDLGNTIYTVSKPRTGVEIINNQNTITVNIPLHSKENHHTVSSFAICHAPLVNWDVPHIAQKIINLDSTKSYHPLSDGMYEEKPSLYEPSDMSCGNCIYKSVAAHLLKSSSEPEAGAYFKVLSASLLYSYMNSYNEKGYIPTRPLVSWLNKDYGLERNVYDTRFNFDTIEALIYALKIYPDPKIKEVVKKALDFYIDFADKNTFYVNEKAFVPDYGDYSGEKSKSHCSLNHYLTEAVTLIRGGLILGDFNYCKYGYHILEQIEDSAKSWIRENNDLWYSISQNGTYEKNDYIDVTYNDLKKAEAVLKKLAVWDKYPGIAMLLSAKESWLKANGYADKTKIKFYID